jgi:hypothetical protein
MCPSTWDFGKLSLQVAEGNASIGKILRLLHGSRLITDWESRYPAREALAMIEKRQHSRAAVRLRSLSETFSCCLPTRVRTWDFGKETL